MSAIATAARLAKKTLLMNVRAFRDWRERKAYRTRPADFWRRLPALVLEEHEPVFFLSTGRCGTLLLTRILDGAPGVVVYHKPAPELFYVDTLAYAEGAEKFEAYKTAALAARFELVADCVIRGRRYVETNQRCTFFAPHLYEVFPRSLFVHLVRHPGSFVRSGVLRRFYEGQQPDLGRITPADGPTRERWPSMSTYQRAAWLWNETNAFIERFKEGRDEKRILTVRADDLFKTPEATLRIFAHCRLPAVPRDRIAAAIGRPVNAQPDDLGIPPYAQWDEARKAEVRPWLPLAERYGYEL